MMLMFGNDIRNGPFFIPSWNSDEGSTDCHDGPTLVESPHASLMDTNSHLDLLNQPRCFPADLPVTGAERGRSLPRSNTTQLS